LCASHMEEIGFVRLASGMPQRALSMHIAQMTKTLKLGFYLPRNLDI